MNYVLLKRLVQSDVAILSTLFTLLVLVLTVAYLRSDWRVAATAESNPGFVAGVCNEALRPILPSGQVPSVSPGSHLRYRPVVEVTNGQKIFTGWRFTGSVRDEEGGDISFICLTDTAGTVTDVGILN